MIQNFFNSLTKQEAEQIEELLVFIKDRLSYSSNLERILQNWLRVTEEVKKGYHNYIYEYINDIDNRHVIQDILDIVKDPLKQKLDEIVKDIDKIFIDNTVRVNDPLVDYDFALKDPEKYFWYFRIPKILTEELKIDLDETGIKKM